MVRGCVAEAEGGGDAVEDELHLGTTFERALYLGGWGATLLDELIAGVLWDTGCGNLRAMRRYRGR